MIHEGMVPMLGASMGMKFMGCSIERLYIKS